MNGFLIANIALALIVAMLILLPREMQVNGEGFVEYVVYGPGPWWYYGGWRHPWHRCRYCPMRRRWYY